MSLEAWADLAVRAARAAGEVIRPLFRTPLPDTDKADASPVTLADQQAETVIRELIGGTFPDHGILGEEFGASRPDAAIQWILDPIDGTRAFMAGKPLFGTLIAVVEHGVPVVGVLYQPILDELWLGVRGQPTRLLTGLMHAPSPQPSPTRGEGAVSVMSCPPVSATEAPADTHVEGISSSLLPLGGRGGDILLTTRSGTALDRAILATTSPSLFTPSQRMAFDRLSQAVRFTDYGGDCYNYGLLAAGHLDVVAENGLQFHDVAALVPIIEGAGGIMTQWDGAGVQQLRYDGSILAAGHAALHHSAKSILVQAEG